MTDPAGLYRYAVGVHLVLNVPKQGVRRAHAHINGEIHPDLTA